MKTSRKIQIDRLVGLPIIVALRPVVWLLGKVLRRDHSITADNVRLIVVAKFLGMGSIIQATPLLRSLKQSYPLAKLTLLTQAPNRPLIERLSHIDDALYVDDRGPLRLAITTLRALVRLIRGRTDIYLDLEVYSAYAGLMSLLSCARNRLGFYRYSTRFKQGVYTHLMYFNTRQSIRDLYLQLGRLAGGQEVDAGELGPIRVVDGDRHSVAQRFGVGGDDGPPYIVVNPNASDLLLERRWPAPQVAQVIEQLTHQHRVMLIGSADEAQYVRQLVSMLSGRARERVTDTAGRLHLGELFALLQGAACVITNDTGPMHMAIALGAPTVCLFGPVQPGHYGLERANVKMIYRAVFCSPCAHEIAQPPCHGNNICMQLIEPSAVIEAARRLIAAPMPWATPGSQATEQFTRDMVFTDADRRPLGMVVKTSVPQIRAKQCEVCAGGKFVTLFIKDDHQFWRCNDCGLRRISPQPTDQTLATIYGRGYYDAWGLGADEQTADRLKKAHFRKQLKRWLKPSEQARLLDCGAAIGFLMEVADEFGFDPYGVELSEYGAARIAEKFGAQRVFHGRFEDAAFDGIGKEGFNAVCMFDFLEHVRDPEAVLRKARCLLKPGGQLLICTPNAGSLTRRLLRSGWLHYKIEHLFYFDRRNLKTLLEKAGFVTRARRPAWKVMNLKYVADQLAAYPHWLLTPVARSLAKVTPKKLERLHFPALFGEMIVLATKAGKKD